MSKNISSMLSEGRVTFSYTKTDGTIRQATGTTKTDLIPEADRSTATNTDESAVIAYYDLGKNGWRSFRRENLKTDSIQAA